MLPLYLVCEWFWQGAQFLHIAAYTINDKTPAMLIHKFFEDTWLGEIKLEDKEKMNQMKLFFLLLYSLVWAPQDAKEREKNKL